MSTKTSKRISAPKQEFFKIESVPLRDAWTDFMLSRQAINCTPATLKNYQSMLGKFIVWLEAQGVNEPHAVTARRVREYLALYADKSDWYLNDHARAIRTLLRFWHKENYLPQPVVFDMPKVHQKRLSFLTAEQVKKVLAVCNLREKAIFLFIVDSGLRRQEVCNLNRSDIDLQTGIVHVWQGKGRRDRISIVGATTRRVLLKYWQICLNKADNAPAFQTKTGERLTGYGLASLIHRLSKKSNIRFSTHSLRRTFATLSLQAGIDLVSLQTLMGHSDIGTTRCYIQWLENNLLEAHRRHSPVDNL